MYLCILIVSTSCGSNAALSTIPEGEQHKSNASQDTKSGTPEEAPSVRGYTTRLNVEPKWLSYSARSAFLIDSKLVHDTPLGSMEEILLY